MPIISGSASTIREVRITKGPFDNTAGNGAFPGTITVATVTGAVYIHRIIPRITQTLTSGGANTVALGTATVTTGMIGATTGTSLAANEFWATTGGGDVGYVNVSDTITSAIISENIIITLGTANLTAGTIVFDIVWEPVTVGASLV